MMPFRCLKATTKLITLECVLCFETTDFVTPFQPCHPNFNLPLKVNNCKM